MTVSTDGHGSAQVDAGMFLTKSTGLFALGEDSDKIFIAYY